MKSRFFTRVPRPASDLRCGFTLVELLVVIAIIGVLVALMLPAVQASREAARRVSCINNIAQLGLAIHNYEASHEALPAGVLDDQGPIRSEALGRHVGWIVQTLPYLEQPNAFRLFDQQAGAYAAVNAPIRKMPLRIVVCPSFSGSDANEDKSAAVSTYAGCHHDSEAPIDEKNHGLLFLNSRIRYCDMLDGSSQTLLAGEILPSEKSLGWVSGARATLRNTGEPINSAPKGPTDEAPSSEPDGLLTVGGFASHHPGIVQFAFADGSAKGLSESIDRKTYQQLAHRADGKLLEERF